MRVEGVTRQGDAADLIPRSVLDPGLYAGSLLALQLDANGIFLDGGVRRDARGDDATLVLDWPGRPLAEIVQLCMKYSNNSIAESLVKNLGAYAGSAPGAPATRQGSWVDGIRALREELAQLGVDLGDAHLVDGSGLSIQNRVTPRVFVEALRAGHRSFAVGPEFVASMPIAERDGTLEKRLRGGDGRIRAKTGLLADASVTSLSGFAERAGRGDADLLDRGEWVFGGQRRRDARGRRAGPLASRGAAPGPDPGRALRHRERRGPSA